MRRQELNVFRMRAERRSGVESGSRDAEGCDQRSDARTGSQMVSDHTLFVGQRGWGRIRIRRCEGLFIA